MRRKTSILVCLLNLVLIANATIQGTVFTIDSYSINQVWEIMQTTDEFLIIDDRPYSEYVEGHIPTAISIELKETVDPTEVDTINAYGKEYNILYCACPNGENSEHHAEELVKLGLDSISYMHESFTDWGYQIVTGSEPGVLVSTTIPTSTPDGGSPPPPLSDLILVNLVLVMVAGLIIYWKKK
ncbi:MAG: rhodanese-like domain-containing protein [Candidatus Thorarchaeota archaeon]